MQLSLVILIVTLAGCSSGETTYGVKTLDEEAPLLLKSFQGFRNDVDDHTGDGTYSFAYHIGDSEREEVRSESGEVNGRFAFVAPEGNEIEATYEADKDGFRVESEALPVAPEDTDDVKAAKEEFFEAYEKALENADSYEYEYAEYEEDSDEESSEESSEEDSDEESSEEDSSEEDSSEEDSSEEDSSEEDEDENEENNAVNHFGISYS